jgi:predicted DNA-binding protein with PD1-like motif
MTRPRSRIVWIAFVGIAAVLAWSALHGSAQPPAPAASPSRFYAFRLRPGQDLRKELYAFARREGVRAGAVVTCVGSLSTVSMRLANRQEATTRTGHFEIVSLVGTLDPAGGHLHMCVADENGVAFGGHLLDGCVVYTTAEIVVADLDGLEFRREVDKTYGYNELVVHPRPGGR